MTAASPENLVRKSLPVFFIFLLLWGGALTAVLVVYYQMQSENYEHNLVVNAEHSLRLQRKMAHNHFAMIVGDLLFLSKQEELKAYLEDPTQQNLSLINSEYRSFSVNKKNYEQIRYLDNQGMEIVRVNYNGGKPIEVSPENLQSKQNRYYFKDAFQLSQGEVFVSPFDLNIEHGKVEEPFKPMIRFATPVFDQSGTKRGVILINYLGQDLLNLFQEINSGVPGETMLVNRDGFWLLHPDAEKEWGFMFPDRAQFSFSRQNPEVWAQILSSLSGELRTSQGLYVYSTIVPLESTYISSTESGDAVGANRQVLNGKDYFWKIISFISAETLSANLSGLKGDLFGLGGMLFLFGTVGLWPLAETIIRRKHFQKQLVTMAHYDALTGLPNRTLFFDRFDQALSLASRYERMCALLYVDLDGFKSVNDTLGHDSGDELLIAVGKKMSSCCRGSDTVARLGGDEFIILLTEISAAEGAEFFAQQILQVFEDPFSLQKGDVTVGASIGISVFPLHGETADQLMTSADKAMYRSKGRGKNTYTSADTLP